ncbi:hypothetical protein KUTeg_021026 [Tegillarca granosa]|uniref:Mediator of RNA polymerase II transcription subunit 20 n=1 Tax=Tegillarca granosa TaxID=220873 RepID=A0ABQ9EC13_TEGGR|nr:hypothetical protein KUTeg_021026 [Tegillarca granosa]
MKKSKFQYKHKKNKSVQFLIQSYVMSVKNTKIAAGYDEETLTQCLLRRETELMFNNTVDKKLFQTICFTYVKAAAINTISVMEEINHNLRFCGTKTTGKRSQSVAFSSDMRIYDFQKHRFHVYAYPVPEGKSGQQVVDTIQKQLEQLGAIKSGNFCVDCETYQSNVQTGTVLVSDLLFELLMAKLTSTKAGRDAFYQQRKGFKIESRGQRYELGDFIIKIGSVSLVSNFKGILVEVEYCPCVVPNDCWNLMKEMLQSIVGNVAENPPPYIKNKLDTLYTPADTINQYLEHFNNFRKSVTVAQQNR